MRKSIFNMPIKDMAKILVQVTNKDIKQTEALNILAKMDGFSSYNKECREFLNHEEKIKEKIDTEIEKLSILWENLNKKYPTEKEYAYLEKIIHIIESFFVFKDNSKIIICKYRTEMDFPNDEKYCIFKTLLDINDNYIRNDVLDYELKDFTPIQIEEDKIYKTLENGIIQEVPYTLTNNISLDDFLLKKHPSKVITWFKEYFDLKYSGYSNSKDMLNTLINDFSNNIKVDIKTSFKEQLSTLEEIKKYLIDIDYEIPEHKLKIRLSYSLTNEEMLYYLYNPLFLDSENDLKKYIQEEFKDIESNINREIFSKYGNNNYFAIGLIKVQFAKIDEEFKDIISDVKDIDDIEQQEEIDINDFCKLLIQLPTTMGMIENPVHAYNTCINKLTTHILRKQSLSKFTYIENYIKNNNKLYSLECKFNCEDDTFNVNKDLTLGTYKYVFEALNYDLVHLMNSTFINILIDIIASFEEKKQTIINIIRAAIKKVNEMNIDSVNNAILELQKQFGEYKNIIEISPDSSQDLSGTEHLVLILVDKKEFTYLMLFYKKESSCFNFCESDFNIPKIELSEL